jgi:hypothetical protein
MDVQICFFFCFVLFSIFFSLKIMVLINVCRVMV